MARLWGNRPSSKPTMTTVGNSKPFAEWSVINPDLGVVGAVAFVGLRQERLVVDEFCQERPLRVVLVVLRGGDELHEVGNALGRLLGVLGSECGDVAACR